MRESEDLRAKAKGGKPDYLANSKWEGPARVWSEGASASRAPNADLLCASGCDAKRRKRNIGALRNKASDEGPVQALYLRAALAGRGSSAPRCGNPRLGGRGGAKAITPNRAAV